MAEWQLISLPQPPRSLQAGIDKPTAHTTMTLNSTHPQPHDLQRSPSTDPQKANVLQRSPRTAVAKRPWAQPHTPRVYRPKVYHLHSHPHPSTLPTHRHRSLKPASPHTACVDQCGVHPYSTSTSTSHCPPPSDTLLRLRRGLHPANPHATVPHSSPAN